MSRFMNIEGRFTNLDALQEVYMREPKNSYQLILKFKCGSETVHEYNNKEEAYKKLDAIQARLILSPSIHKINKNGRCAFIDLDKVTHVETASETRASIFFTGGEQGMIYYFEDSRDRDVFLQDISVALKRRKGEPL